MGTDKEQRLKGKEEKVTLTNYIHFHLLHSFGPNDQMCSVKETANISPNVKGYAKCQAWELSSLLSL